MPSFIIGWDYLTGRYVATHPASRQQAEWPPHPGRVFMALAAAWFETDEDPAEGQALRWLETLGDPELILPFQNEVFHRTVVNVFVPVNDKPGPSSAILQSAPITRSKQARTFPSVWVGEVPCFLRWPDVDADQVDRHRTALEKLCSKVTRIGHSSSLVRMWVADTQEPLGETWVPDDGLGEFRVRSHRGVSLDRLPEETGIRRIKDFSRLEAVINTATVDAKGQQMKQQAEIEYQQIFGKTWARSATAPPFRRPKLGLWTGYRRKEIDPPQPVPHTDFDSDLLVLTQVEGPRLALASTWMITKALRGAILSYLSSNIPEWISGHKLNGDPLRNGNQQLAFVPLPFVGHEHADGHLLGLGLVFPRSVPRSERGRVLGRFLLNENGEPRDIHLTLGPLGVWTIRKRDWIEHRQALQPESWTAHPKGATTWATVTPVVLDRFPKCDPSKERAAWQDEVAELLATACERLGLPKPVEIAVGTTSWHRGSPRAIIKRRPLRGHLNLSQRDTVIGDGFPEYPTRQGNAARPQIHAWLRFPEPVIGPILLGAGRFHGYGFCKPI